MTGQNNGSVLPFNRNAEFFYRRARVRDASGEVDEAIRLYLTACEKDPTNADYALELSAIYNRMLYHDSSYNSLINLINSGAISHESLASGKSDAVALFLLAEDLGMFGMGSSALAIIKLLRNYPNCSVPSERISEFTSQMIALEITPGRHLRYARLIRRMTCLADAQNARLAGCVARRYIRRAPKSGIACAMMAWAALMRNDANQATAYTIPALAMKVPDPWSLAIAARVLSGVDAGQARMALMSAANISTSLACSSFLMRQAAALGMDELVCELSGRILSDYPPCASDFAYSAAAMINSGKPTQTALNQLKRALLFFPGDITLKHYVRLIQQHRRGDAQLSYPDDEMPALIREKLSDAQRLSEEGYAAHRFSGDKELIALLEWGLYYRKPEVRAASATLLIRIGGAAAQNALWKFLSGYTLPDEARYAVLDQMITAAFPLPRLIFIKKRLRRMDSRAMSMLFSHDEPRMEIRLASRRLREYPTAIFELRRMYDTARLNCTDGHVIVNALECAYRMAHGEELKLREIAHRRNIYGWQLVSCVRALSDAAKS